MPEPKRSPLVDTSDRELILSRVFDAPRELVWDAWTDPKKVVQWWGPKGFTTTIEVMDVRPGGKWKHVMHGPDGTDYPNETVFLEVVRPERIVYSARGGKKGDPGAEFEATWTFEEQNGKTKLTLHMVFPTAEVRKHVVDVYGAIEGGQQTLARLCDYLAKPSSSETTNDGRTKMSEPAMKKSSAVQLEPPRLENGNEFLFAGMREHYTPENMKNIPELWQRFAPHIGNIHGQVGRVAYGLCFNANNPKGMDYMTAVAVSSSAGLPSEFVVAAVPAQKYAVFTHHGHVSKLFKTLDAIDKWVPESGLQVSRENTELPCFFERYSEQFDPQTGMGGMEVWLPIKA